MAMVLPVASLRTVGLALVLAVALPGCFSRSATDRCQEVREYQNSGSVPAFGAPEGLAQPPAPERFAIPAAGSAGTQAGEPAAAGCLDRPPDYFDRPVAGQPEGRDSPPAGP